MLRDIPKAQTQLFTDTSESGRGAHSSGVTVQLMSDNATVVSYITKQGGTTS